MSLIIFNGKSYDVDHQKSIYTTIPLNLITGRGSCYLPRGSEFISGIYLQPIKIKNIYLSITGTENNSVCYLESKSVFYNNIYTKEFNILQKPLPTGLIPYTEIKLNIETDIDSSYVNHITLVTEHVYVNGLYSDASEISNITANTNLIIDRGIGKFEPIN